MSKPRLGISACLLGKRVRHNGESKENDWLIENLGPFVTWVSVCPEMEMGLGVPRETMRLVGTAVHPQLVTVRSAKVLTQSAQETAHSILERGLEVDAFIFKKDSPSCGLERVKVYGKSGIPIKNGIGIFARAVSEAFPHIPMIEEGRLSDRAQRESFVIRLFTLHRFDALDRRVAEVQKFHAVNKLLLMAISPSQYSVLGKIAANSERKKVQDVVSDYRRLLFKALLGEIKVPRLVNALEHMFGFLKNILDAQEKASILEVIQEFGQGDRSLASPLTLIEHLAKKHKVHYLSQQSIFRPYPKGLKI